MKSDKYFLKIAIAESAQSSCVSRRVGAIVVNGGKILSRGFNDTHSRSITCGKGGCFRCLLRFEGKLASGESRSNCLCAHAEVYTLQITDTDFSQSENVSMYISIPPCEECARAIHKAGISRVIYEKPDHNGSGIEYLKRHAIDAIGLEL